MPDLHDRSIAKRERRALTWPVVRQTGRLAIGVGGTLGGAILLATNVIPVAAGTGALHWVPLLANAALIFGGAMFLREYRKGSATHQDATDR